MLLLRAVSASVIRIRCAVEGWWEGIWYWMGGMGCDGRVGVWLVFRCSDSDGNIIMSRYAYVFAAFVPVLLCMTIQRVSHMTPQMYASYNLNALIA